jgi:hypothetical protein
MQIRLVTLFFISFFGALLLLGNKNGRASSAGKGNTGAPGDETISINNPAPKTCVNCHNTGPLTASVALSVLDSANNPIAQYIPGKVYTARFTITASGGNNPKYGFQMIGLKDNGNTDLDGFSDVNPNNYKIATIANGRTYAEHDNASTSNIFNVKWTAPAAGTGNVTLYASGNAVNNNGTSSGDGAAFTKIQLPEAGTASDDAPFSNLAGSVRLNPTLFQDNAQVFLDLPSNDYRMMVVHAASGQVVQDTYLQVRAQENLQIPASDWPSGVYYFILQGSGQRFAGKGVKM